MTLDRLIASLPVMSKDVARLRPLMLRLARDVSRRTGTPAEDVLQTFLLRLLCAARRFKPHASASTFAYAVLTSEARAAVRLFEHRRHTVVPPVETTTEADHVERQYDARQILRQLAQPMSRRRYRETLRAARIAANG